MTPHLPTSKPETPGDRRAVTINISNPVNPAVPYPSANISVDAQEKPHFPFRLPGAGLSGGSSSLLSNILSGTSVATKPKPSDEEAAEIPLPTKKKARRTKPKPLPRVNPAPDVSSPLSIHDDVDFSMSTEHRVQSRRKFQKTQQALADDTISADVMDDIVQDFPAPTTKK